jgi:hypothetical protein
MRACVTSLHLNICVSVKISTLSFGRLEDIGVIYEGVKSIDVSGIDDGYLALHGNGELRLGRRRRYRIGVGEVFVRFEGKFHIAFVVGIVWLLHEVVLCDEAPKRSVTVLCHVFLYVCEEDGNFEQLITFCGVAQIDAEE